VRAVKRSGGILAKARGTGRRTDAAPAAGISLSAITQHGGSVEARSSSEAIQIQGIRTP
jgi:hypothetical protein